MLPNGIARGRATNVPQCPGALAVWQCGRWRGEPAVKKRQGHLADPPPGTVALRLGVALRTGRKRITYLLQQQVGLHRFANVVVCPQLHGLNSILHIGITCHDDKGRVHALRAQPPQQIKSVVVGHAQVRQHQLWRITLGLPQQFDGRPHTRCGAHLKTFFAQPC